MSDITFAIPLSYRVSSIDNAVSTDQVVEALLTGDTVEDVCDAYQALSSEVLIDKSIYRGFMYDELYNNLIRYPDLVTAINAVRTENGKVDISAGTSFI